VIGIFIYFGRGIITEFYTNIDSVGEQAGRVLILLAFFYQLDAA
jgi:Na+-driven multidrug efflux pump